MATEVLSPTPIFKAFDNNGTPLAGGKLFTYQAGTSTKLATYTDSTGGSPNSNPVILNSRGECNLWIPPNTAYKYVLAPSTDTDPPTAPIWTVDQVVNAQILTLYGGVDTGIVNAYVLTYSANFTSYTDGIGIYWIPAHNNTGPSTINVNGLGVVNIVNQDGSALGANQLIANQIAFILCKGGQFLLSSIVGSGGILSVAGINLTGTTVPANGWYLQSANVLAGATNSVLRITVDNTGHWGTTSPTSVGYAWTIQGIAGSQTMRIYENLNSIAALKDVATFESGSFTATLTGCASAPTQTMNWSRNGNAITLELPANILGTSISTSCTLTGLPASLTPARAQVLWAAIEDNSVAQAGVVRVSGTVLTFGTSVNPGATFTAAGTKGILAFALTYNLT